MSDRRDPVPDRSASAPTPSLLAKIADELRHNDNCGPGPLSEDEYMDDARAILRIIDQHDGDRLLGAGAIAGLTRERDRLRVGISWVRGMCSDEEPLTEIDHTLGELLSGGDGVVEKAVSLRAENARYREALEDIAQDVDEAVMRETARAALDEQPAQAIDHPLRERLRVMAREINERLDWIVRDRTEPDKVLANVSTTRSVLIRELTLGASSDEIKPTEDNHAD